VEPDLSPLSDAAALRDEPSCVLITGLQAAGKSSVGRALAERIARSAFIEGDLFGEMIVSGRVRMSDAPQREARRQLHLRYDLATAAAVTLRAAGFTTVHSDIILGDDLAGYAAMAGPGPVRIVVLAPDAAALTARERARSKDAYGRYSEGDEALEEVIQRHLVWLDESPEIGIRVDSSAQLVGETVDEILSRWDEALVRVPSGMSSSGRPML
jgi:cytidylate kinase